MSSFYHRTGASVPRTHKPSHGPLTVDERAEIIDRLSAGSAPRACLVRKLLRLLDEERAVSEGRLRVLNEKAEELASEWRRAERAEAEVQRLKALKEPEKMPVSGV